MGCGDGRRKKKKSKTAPKRVNNNEGKKDKTVDEDDSIGLAMSAACANDEKTSEERSEGNGVKSPGDSSQACVDTQLAANEVALGALALSDNKENVPHQPNSLSDSLHSEGFHGFEAIDRACRILYPINVNKPIISSPAVKMWLGGAVPLDFVKIFYNEGCPADNVPPHWHYVGYGLSDLHGDGRVHVPTGRGYPSGFGFELTFRLKKEDMETQAPAWPVRIMNELAAYCFNSGKRLNEYDHIPWNEPLNIAATKPGEAQSQIRHVIIVEDPKLLDLDTPNGFVNFLQIVGIVDDELNFTRAWTTFGVMEYLMDHPQIGPVLVTDMGRTSSTFELQPEMRKNLMARIEEDGSNLANITAYIYWFDLDRKIVGTRDNLADQNLDHISTVDRVIIGHVKEIESVHIHIDPIAADVLPVMVKGRLMKDAPFVFDSPSCIVKKMRQTIHFVPHTFKGPGNIFVTEEAPMKGEGGFLQIFCSQDFIDEMADRFEHIERAKERARVNPLIFIFTSMSLTITIHQHYLRVVAQHNRDKKLATATPSNDGDLD